MRPTQVLFRQHIGRAFRTLWQTQRERRVVQTPAEKILTSMNIQVKDPLEVVAPPKKFTKIEVESLWNELKFDEKHPDWKARTCLVYKHNNVLQAGVPQACLLTKTIKIDDRLPKQVEDLISDIPDHVNNLVQRIIYTSNIYDAEQVKLQKIKDPNRPAWVYPRIYGITQNRRILNLSKKFLQLCEFLVGSSVAQTRYVVQNGITSASVDKESDLVQFDLKMDMMLMSLTLLTPIAHLDVGAEYEMPDIYPLHSTISLGKTNWYKTEDIYPVSNMSPYINVHTIFINHDPEEVKNVTELPVTEDQIHARSMIHSFTVAAVCARKKFGSDVKQLPEPVTVQCIQSDGQKYHFSVFQLNTLDIDGTEGVRNFWWSSPSIKLFEKAQYENGRPVLEGYNAEVFKRFFAFYKNR